MMRRTYEHYDVLINGRTYARFTERRHAEAFITLLRTMTNGDVQLRVVERASL